MTNARQETAAQKKLRQEKRAREEALRDLEATFGTDAGKRTLRRLHAAAALDDPKLPGACPPGWTAGDLAIYAQGQRSVILQLERDLAEARNPEEEQRPGATRTGTPTRD